MSRREKRNTTQSMRDALDQLIEHTPPAKLSLSMSPDGKVFTCDVTPPDSVPARLRRTWENLAFANLQNNYARLCAAAPKVLPAWNPQRPAWRELCIAIARHDKMDKRGIAELGLIDLAAHVEAVAAEIAALADTPPKAPEQRDGEGVDLPDRVNTARDQYIKASEKLDKNNPTDREAYDLLDRIKAPLPAFSTWTSYLRQWRRATGQQKRRPRADKLDDAGRSIVRRDQI